ncbi:MAG: hypothetical protein ABL927_01985 [Bdellovibrionales bacterium]
MKLLALNLGLMLVILSLNASAAIDKKIAPLKKLNQYLELGQFSGGEAGTTHSLLGVRSIISQKDKLERLILDLGNSEGKPLLGKISYFQVSIEPNNPRIIIDLSQIAASSVNDETIKSLVKKSPYIKSAKVHFDPSDTSISIQLFLKKKMKMEAFQLLSKNEPGRIAIDLHDTN